MLGDGAKRAAAKAAAHDVDAEANHLPRGDFGAVVVAAIGVGIARVRAAGIAQVEHQIHLGRGQRDRRRVDPHVFRGRAFAVGLHQRAGVAGVGLQMQHAVGVGVEHSVGFDFFVRGQADDGSVTRRFDHVVLMGQSQD